jgi:hypothetical protein
MEGALSAIRFAREREVPTPDADPDLCSA